MNDDHSMIAFVLDIGDMERLTGGIKDMQTNQVLRGVKLENISQMEFARGRDVIFVVETDEMNRPFKVKKLNIHTQQESTVFVDHDPTHYIDISVTKDRKYLVINSNTKEDSEVWVLDREENVPPVPIKIIPRRADVRAHIDHLRDFFIMITNFGVKSKNYKLATLKDTDFSDENFNQKWEDLIVSSTSGPGEKDGGGFIINEFDGFKDFIAIYIKNQGRPEILIQDLDTKEFNTIKMEDVGEVVPALNQDYEQKTLRYTFSNPFIYQQIFEYDHTIKNKKLLKELKLVGAPQIMRSQFECKQFLVPSHDGEEVPMNVYFKKGITLNRRNKTFIDAYGAYGINLN